MTENLETRDLSVRMLIFVQLCIFTRGYTCSRVVNRDVSPKSQDWVSNILCLLATAVLSCVH